MKRDFVKILKYAWRSQLYVKWLLLIAGLIVFYYLIRILVQIKTEDPVFRLLDPIFGLITGLLAIALWYNDMKERWEDSLSKKLTVHFAYKNQFVLSCLEAYLSHQADIRNFAQQIGSQMSNSKQLKFYPFMHQLPRQLKFDKTSSEPYWNFEIFFFLREDIENGNAHIIWHENDLNDLGESKEIILEERKSIDLDQHFKLPKPTE